MDHHWSHEELIESSNQMIRDTREMLRALRQSLTSSQRAMTSASRPRADPLSSGAAAQEQTRDRDHDQARSATQSAGLNRQGVAPRGPCPEG
jgi:hypothetical protein